MKQKNRRSRPDAAKHTGTAAFISALIYYIFFGIGTHEQHGLFRIPNETALHGVLVEDQAREDLCRIREMRDVAVRTVRHRVHRKTCNSTVAGLQDRGGLTVFLPSFDDEPQWLAQGGAPSRTTAWLHIAWEQQARVELFRGALKRAEATRDQALALARRDGIDAIDLGHGTVRTIVGPRTRTRVLDTDRFETAYPEVFRKVARQWVRITDAEREVGKTAIAEFCSIREDSERIGLVYEPTSNPFVDEEAEP